MGPPKQPRGRKPAPPGAKGQGRQKEKWVSPERTPLGRLLLIAVPVIFLVIAGVAIFLLVGAREQPIAKAFPIQGIQHIKEGESHPPYNSNPPTSGWHYGTAAPWGVHERELPDEQVVHNLEHGGIWISYHPSLDGETVDKLREIVRRYRSKVILTPRAKNDTKIALAAWGRLDTFDALDEGRALGFIRAFIDQGPEKVAD